jgi:hypothetical protein
VLPGAFCLQETPDIVDFDVTLLLFDDGDDFSTTVDCWMIWIGYDDGTADDDIKYKLFKEYRLEGENASRDVVDTESNTTKTMNTLTKSMVI